MALLQNLFQFLYAVIAHWQALLTGGIVTAIVGLIERRTARVISWRSYAIIFSAFVLYSFFAAWQDEHRNTATVSTEKSALSAELASCISTRSSGAAVLAGKNELVDSLQQSLSALQAPLAQQQANIGVCVASLAKMNPKVKEHISVIPVYVGTMNAQGSVKVGGPPAQGLPQSEFVLLVATNIEEGPFHGLIRC